ncbi:MAG: HD domain-containing phosphohydrolase [Vicinamibacterales bacterium]
MELPSATSDREHLPAGYAAVSQSQVLAGLSYALDLTEGQRPGHSVRSCLIGMRLADELRMPTSQRASLFFALLMKDLGCSSNAARFAALFGNHDHDIKTDLKHIDWSKAIESFRFVLRNASPGAFLLKRTWRLLAIMARGPEGAREVVRTRCERGAEIASMLGLPDESVQAIRALDEHWDGLGQPYAKRGEEIPLHARIMNLAQTVEVFCAAHGVDVACEVAATRRGRWFAPDVVDALFSFRNDTSFWTALQRDDVLRQVAGIAPADQFLRVDDDRLDLFATAFARVIDAKSPWTYLHSNGVADVSVAIARRLGMDESNIRLLRRAALLHDIGKLGVSNLILDKPGKLTDDEFRAMRSHTGHSLQILSRVPCFAELASEAAGHHERLDGRGYHRGLSARDILISTRILAVADICDALRSSRPYRAGLPAERVLEIIDRESGTALDPVVVQALHAVLESADAGLAQTLPAARVVPALDEDYGQAA